MRLFKILWDLCRNRLEVLDYKKKKVSVLRRKPLRMTGKFYDLKAMFETLRLEPIFQTQTVDEVLIGWSNVSKSGAFRYMTFGTYDRQRNQIRLNPLLDDEKVPPYFVEFVVYHEMLHAVCKPEIDTRGRMISHTKEFRRLEKKFPQYAEAKEWERKSLKFFQMRQSHGRS